MIRRAVRPTALGVYGSGIHASGGGRPLAGKGNWQEKLERVGARKRMAFYRLEK